MTFGKQGHTTSRWYWIGMLFFCWLFFSWSILGVVWCCFRSCKTRETTHTQHTQHTQQRTRNIQDTTHNTTQHDMPHPPTHAHMTNPTRPPTHTKHTQHNTTTYDGIPLARPLVVWILAHANVAHEAEPCSGAARRAE